MSRVLGTHCLRHRGRMAAPPTPARAVAALVEQPEPVRAVVVAARQLHHTHLGGLAAATGRARPFSCRPVYFVRGDLQNH
jgi:hypothetical protein